MTFPSVSTPNTSALVGMCESPRKPEPSTTAAPEARGWDSDGGSSMPHGVPMGSHGVPWSHGPMVQADGPKTSVPEADRRRAFADVKVRSSKGDL